MKRSAAVVMSGSLDGYDVEVEDLVTGVDCQVDRETGEVTPSMTSQEFREEVDINTLVRRFHLTGQLPTNVAAPTYADFTNVPDFQSAMNAIVKSREAFDAMPADVRARFDNNPAKFVDFCSNDDNRAEAEKLGLVFKKPEADAAAAALMSASGQSGRGASTPLQAKGAKPPKGPEGAGAAPPSDGGADGG